jgi:GxxExxY protein
VPDIIYKDESYMIMGACFEVYKEMGCGFLEPVYQECLEIELASQGILFRSQVDLALRYKGVTWKQIYIPDFICWEKIILEVKAVKELAPEHRAQGPQLPARNRLQARPPGRLRPLPQSRLRAYRPLTLDLSFVCFVVT